MSRGRLLVVRSVAVLVVSIFCVRSVTAAQQRRLPRFCEEFRPGCKGTVITEALFGIQNHGTLTALTLGVEGTLMRNFERGAIGLGAYWAIQSHGYRWGIKPRVRRWLTDDITADLSMGLVLNSGEDRFSPKYPGYVIQGNVAFKGVHGGMIRVEFLRDGINTSTRDVTLGGHLGAKPGAAASAFLVFLAAFAEYAKQR